MKASFTRLLGLINKEFHQITRDPSSILIAVILPLILLFLYGYGVSLDIDHLKIGVVMEDSSPLAQSFVRSLSDSPYFDLTLTRTRQPLYHKLVRGEIRAIAIIPSYFSQFFQTQTTIAPFQIITDGSEPNTANFAQNYIRGAWQNWLQQLQISDNLTGLPLTQVQSRIWYNEQLESRNFLIPGSLALIMTLIGTLLTALVVAREWERGTMEALMATPVRIGEMILAKLIPYYVLAILSMMGSVLVATLFYHVPFRGSILVLYLASTLFLFCALGLGLLISSIARNQFVAAQTAIVTAYLPAFILSGFLFEISSMPTIIQWTTFLIPARYLVICLQTLFLVGTVWEVLLPALLFMGIFALILFLIIAKRTVKRLD